MADLELVSKVLKRDRWELTFSLDGKDVSAVVSRDRVALVAPFPPKAHDLFEEWTLDHQDVVDRLKSGLPPATPA